MEASLGLTIISSGNRQLINLLIALSPINDGTSAKKLHRLGEF
jgi:hypothetical protein